MQNADSNETAKDDLTPEQIWSELDREESAGELPPDNPAQDHAESARGEQHGDEVGEQNAATANENGQQSVAALSEEDRAMLKQLPELVHLVKTTVGRVGSLQSELQKIGKAAASQAADSPTDKQIAQASGNPEAWNKLKEDFPDWAEGVEALVSARIPSAVRPADVEKIVGERVAAVRAEIQAQLEKDAEEELDDIRPGWRDIVRTKEFADWLTKQPADYQQRAANAWRPAAVLRVIESFEKAKQPEPAKQQPNRRLAAAAIPSGTNKVNLTKSLDEMTPEELWLYYEERDRRAARS